jgi:hypothetical protein
MKFTERRNGKMMTTVRVDHNLTRQEIQIALASYLWGENLSFEKPSRARFMRLMKIDLRDGGHLPDEFGADKFLDRAEEILKKWGI